jgi:hypothetical protein
MAVDLPKYSWGLDPSTNSWGYFLNKTGPQSADVGRKAGDKLASYKADPHDAASLQQQALEHLMDTQLTAAAPAAAVVDPNAAKTPIANMSGIASAIGGSNHSNSRTGGPDGGDPEWHGDFSSEAFPGIGAKKWGDLTGDEQNGFRGEHETWSKLSDFARKAIDNNTVGKVGNFINSIFGGTTPDESQGYGGMPVSVGGDSTDSVGSGEAAATLNAPQVNAQAQSDAEAGAAADSARAVAAAAAEGAASDPHERSDSGSEAGNSGSAPGGGAAKGGLAQNSHIVHRNFAVGGDSGLQAAAQPRFMRGAGDGQSDSIPVSMDDGGQGHLADNEFVFPADVVSALGSGSSEAGARALYEMVDRIRQQAHGHTKQANPVDPKKVMPV